MRLRDFARFSAALAVLLAALTATPAQSQTSASDAGSAIAPFVQVPGLPGTPAEALAIDPHDGRRVYADGGGGRIARSVSGGEHWEVAQAAGIYESFRAITVDPVDPDVVVAFSTSDTDGGASAGVYISRDRGAHWLRFPNQPVGARGKAGFGRGALVDVDGRSIVLADKRQGIFVSRDFGGTWTNPLPSSAAHTYTLVRDPNDARTLWAGGADASGAVAVWVSHDVGETWTKFVVPIAARLRGALVTALAIQPGSGRVLAGVNGFGRFGLGGEMRISDDGGAHWTQATVTAQQWAAGNAIVFSSQSDSIVYASGNGSFGFLQSLDGGLSWAQVLVPDGSGFFSLALARASAGRDERLFGAGTGTIDISDNGGMTWARADRGLELAGVNEIAESGLDSGTLYAQNGFGGLFRSDDDTHWTPIDPVAGIPDTADIAVDLVAWNHPLYALTFLNTAGLSRSDDQGRHWSTLAAPLPSQVFQEALIADPTRAGTLYVFVSSTAPFNSVLQTTDFGATWRQVPIGVAGDFAAMPEPLRADPNRPGVVYAAMGSGLWKSADFGLTWNLVPQLPLGLAGIAGLAVTSGPSGAVFVVAGADDGTFSLQQSRDGGVSWSPATSAFGTSPYLLLRTGGDTLFAYQWLYAGCGDPSVLQSRDGASTWSLVDGSIESMFDPGDCLSVIPTQHHVFVGDPFGTWLSFVKDLGGEDEAMQAESRRSGLSKALMSDDRLAPPAANHAGWGAPTPRDP